MGQQRKQSKKETKVMTMNAMTMNNTAKFEELDLDLLSGVVGGAIVFHSGWKKDVKTIMKKDYSGLNDQEITTKVLEDFSCLGVTVDDLADCVKRHATDPEAWREAAWDFVNYYGALP